MSRVSNDVNALEQFITHGTILTAVAFVRLFGATIVLLALEWRLALLSLLPVPFIALGLRWFSRRASIYRKVRDRLSDINATQDDLAGIRVIQALMSYGLERFQNVSATYMGKRIASIACRHSFLLNCVQPGRVLVLGRVYMVVRGRSPWHPGCILVLHRGVLRTDPSFDRHRQYHPAGWLRPTVSSSCSTTRRSEMPTRGCAAKCTGWCGSRASISITVTVKRSRRDFHVKPGSNRIEGPSGAGKTSIANLLCRFYDPTHGQVRSTADLRECNRFSAKMRVVPDTFLNSSIRRNLLSQALRSGAEQLAAVAMHTTSSYPCQMGTIRRSVNAA
jgi:ABC-type multidrug transport system fused ATPase/permease subunit